MVADVKRAFFHAKSEMLTYVQLPPEDVLPGEENMCGGLNFSTYGPRDAAANWANEYSERFKKLRFTLGLCTPSIFTHAEKGLKPYVHGDDFVLVGPDAELERALEELRQHFELEVKGWIGCHRPGTVSVLHRIIREQHRMLWSTRQTRGMRIYCSEDWARALRILVVRVFRSTQYLT